MSAYSRIKAGIVAEIESWYAGNPTGNARKRARAALGDAGSGPVFNTIEVDGRTWLVGSMFGFPSSGSDPSTGPDPESADRTGTAFLLRGLQSFLHKVNVVSGSNPTAGDDVDDGYDPGSRWLRTDTGRSWTCHNASAGAAVWVEDTGGGGGGGGDNVTINTVAVVDVDFDDATPAAPAGDLNVKWQRDSSSPNNVSAYVDVSVLEPLVSHANLASAERVWSSSGHTGTINTFAAFNGSGAAAYLALPLAVGNGGTGATTEADARIALGLVIGTDVQAQDPQLQAIAGLAPAADELQYWTGATSAALTGLTAYARTLLDDSDAPTARGTLGAADTTLSFVLINPDASAPNGLALGPGALTSIGSGADIHVDVAFAATQRIAGRNAGGAGLGEELSISTVLDWLGSTNGMILVRSGGVWTALPAHATVGHVLTNNGTGTAPSWQAAAGGAPSGPAGGQLGGNYPNPDVRGIRTTTGPTLLTLGAIADGQELVRVGTDVVGRGRTPYRVTFNVVGNGSAITTGEKDALPPMLIAGTIVGWALSTDVAGSVTLDIWKANGSIPTNANTITASAKPATSSSRIASSTTLTGWTTSVAVGDVMVFEVEAVSGGVTRATLVIDILPT